MIDKKSYEVDFEFFSSQFIDGILWIYFKKNLFIQATQLINRDALLSFLNRVSACGFIKVVVFRSFLEESGYNEYINFFEVIKARHSNLDLHRLYNFYSALVLKLTEMNKIVIHATSGNVIPLFLNTSLACDYRVAADNTMFKNAYLDIGVLPIGGGAYFLSRMLGEGKALELLALKNSFSAQDALEFGIIDAIMPLDELETRTNAIARQFGNVATPTLSGLKSLVRFSSRDLKKYLEYEDQEFFKIIHHQSFRNACG